MKKNMFLLTVFVLCFVFASLSFARGGGGGGGCYCPSGSTLSESVYFTNKGRLSFVEYADRFRSFFKDNRIRGYFSQDFARELVERHVQELFKELKKDFDPKEEFLQGKYFRLIMFYKEYDFLSEVTKEELREIFQQKLEKFAEYSFKN